MKNLLMIFAFGLVSSISYAGGSMGGGGFGLKDELALSLMDAAFNIDSLPKTFVDPSDFRRAKARLSVDGVKTFPMLLNGESIDVRSLRGSVVDANISKEVLPRD
jgi:hypothetical protein